MLTSWPSADRAPEQYDQKLLLSVINRKLSTFSISAVIGSLAALVVCFALSATLSIAYLAGWFMIIQLTITLRAFLSRSIRKSLNGASYVVLCRHHEKLLYSSITIQFTWGSCIWLTNGTATNDVALFLTSVVAFYGLAIISTQSDDVKTYVYSILALHLQPCIYWFNSDVHALAIGIYILFSCVVPIAIVHSANNSYRRVRIKNLRLASDLRRAQKKSEMSEQAMAQAITDKATFMASASHDLRQPLYGIKMINEMLMLQSTSDRNTNLLELQCKSINATTDLLNGIMDLAILESDKAPIKLKKFNIQRVLESMASEFRLLAENKGLQLHVDFPNVTVLSDYNLVTRVLRNLMSNAINHTIEGEVIVKCTIDVNKLAISIIDTGVGISETDHLRIFHQFVRLSKTTEVLNVHSGLGLAIVKKIDNVLNLRLQLTSQLGLGSNFSFSLIIAD